MHKIKSSGVSSEVSTQATSTQIKPTFSRQDLGAELNNSINVFFQNFNPKSYTNIKQINGRQDENKNGFTKEPNTVQYLSRG